MSDLREQYEKAQDLGKLAFAGNIRRVLAKPFSPREILACAHELLNHQLNAVCRG
jgi:hypothetical protein